MARRLTWLLIGLLGGCWADFPDGALHVEAGVADLGQPDTGEADGTAQPDGASCPPGACCDEDDDGQTTCQGDCNDDDNRVHPGQSEFFTTDSDGSFDYNCDGQEEPKWPDRVTCNGSGGKCSGAGWGTGQPTPACGESAAFFTCKMQEATCQPTGDVQKVQACR